MLGIINTAGGSTYYYGNNRYRARFPWKERNIEDLTIINDINEEVNLLVYKPYYPVPLA